MAGTRIVARPASVSSKAVAAAGPRERPSIRLTSAIVSETNSFPELALVISFKFLFQMCLGLTTELLQLGSDQKGVQALLHQVVGDGREELHFAVLRPAEHYDGAAGFLAKAIYLLPHLLFRRGRHFADDDLGSVHVLGTRQQLVGGAGEIGGGPFL